MSIPETLSTPKLALQSNGMLLLPDEFDTVTEYDEDYCYELIHGVVIVNPIPSEAESDPNEELGYLLRSYKEHHASGTALDATMPERYVYTRDSRRRADRVIWAGLRRRPEPKTDVPAIVVEFVSPSKRDRRRDYIEKRREYLAAGVIEYWIIDRFRRALTVYRARPEMSGGFDELAILEHETYQTDVLPGFELPLARILSIADEWVDPGI